jgi:hypothetical protein
VQVVSIATVARLPEAYIKTERRHIKQCTTLGESSACFPVLLEPEISSIKILTSQRAASRLPALSQSANCLQQCAISTVAACGGWLPYTPARGRPAAS